MEENDKEGDRSDGGDSNSSESESELEERVKELQDTIEASAYHYDSHVQLIRLLRQLGDLDKARRARRNMHKIFPLSEELWLEWIGDELPLCSIPEAAMEMKELFETAVKDYLSVTIWLQFAQFAVERMSMMPEGVAFPRDIFERAIVSCGLHVSQAGQLWSAYLDFELAVMTSLQQMQQNDPSDEDMKEQVEEQYERLEKVCKRKCAVPHIGLDALPDGLREVLDITEENSPAYVRAKKKLEEYLPFETQLETSSPPTLESYYSYLSHLTSTKENPTLINTLYQRAVAHHCLDLELWKQYLKFLESSFKRAGSILLPCYEQAVRNCPWVMDFWVGYARAMERNAVDCEQIHVLFDRALEPGNLTEGKDYLELWTAYCDSMRRRINFETDSQEEVGKKMDELRAVFTRARSHLNKYYSTSGDPTDSLSRYQAAVEVQYHEHTPSDDTSTGSPYGEAKSLWKDVMTRHGREAHYWLEYANMERKLDHLEECRKVYQMAINSASDEPEKVCEAMLQFERELGSLDTFEAALEKCGSQLKRIKERRDKAAEKEAQKKEEAKKLKKSEKVKQKKGRLGTADSAETEKSPQKQKAAKRTKTAHKQSGHVFFEGSSDEEGAGPVAKKPRVADDQIKKPPVTSVTFVPAETAPPNGEGEKTLDTPMSTTGGQPSAMTSSLHVAMETTSEKPEVVGSKESRTVFVSNLAMATTEERLRELFSKCGSIADIRLIKTRHASSKRANSYAYVEFTSPDPVPLALALDRGDLDGRPLYVSRFKEKGATEKQQSAQHSDNKCTLFVSNIQHHFGDHDLKELFQQCGPLKEVRLVKNRSGKSKGFAYVEYLSESSAREAVMKMDQYQLGGKRINVAISNPPKRAGASGAGETPTDQDASGCRGDGFKKPSFIPPQTRRPHPPTSEADPFARRSKTNISLVPRAIARKTESAPGNQQGPAGKDGKESNATKMSNDDFRKLLSK